MKYIVKNLGQYHLIECNGFSPTGYEEVLDCPVEVEHPNDCDIVEEQDVFGMTIKRVVFNETKRAARWAQELADKYNAEAQAEVEKNLRVALKNKFDNYRQQFLNVKDAIEAVNPDTISNVATAKTVVANLKAATGQLGLIQFEMAKDLFELVVRTL